jgi:thioester reductase-like protein
MLRRTMTMSDERDARTLVDVLERHLTERGAQLAYRMLGDDDFENGVCWSYSDVARYAGETAVRLADTVDEQQRVLLLYPPGLDFVGGLLGCFRANVVAVPVYPPDPTRLDRSLDRLRGIVRDATPTAVLTTSTVRDALDRAGISARPELAKLAWIATDEWRSTTGANAGREPRPEDIAMLQYTSGSTGDPAGVVISHENLMHNERQLRDAVGHDTESSGVTWLPVYHDMGLIGGVLQALYCGRPIAMMSPLDFLQKPVRWLEAITRFKATTSGGPNFALELCCKRITANEIEKLDLSTWRVAFCGAEPVRPSTLDAFARQFEPAGFRREALYPCFGLAEATLLVTGGWVNSAPAVRSQHGSPLDANGVPHQGSYVSCGRPQGGQQVKIVDPESRAEIASGEEGEIWVMGPNVAQGYWNRPDDTRQTFGAMTNTGDGPYLRTGDLGFDLDGELFVTGRLKDVIVVRGQNYHPEDLEQTIERSHEMIRRGCTAVFGVTKGPGESVVAAVEVRERLEAGDRLDVLRAIRSIVSREHGIAVDDIVLLRPRTLPKTSSGKMRRFECRGIYLAGGFGAEGDGTDAENSSHESAAYETEVADILMATTGTSSVGVDGDFFADLGGDSVGAAESVAQLNVRFGIDLPLRAVYDYPTVRELSACVERHVRRVAEPDEMSGDAAKQFFESEVVSIARVESRETRRRLVGEPILVTGATGSFGPYLVAELLRQTDTSLVCLIRAESEAHGWERLKHCLDEAGLWRAEYRRRIRPLVGDLAAPSLGLCQEDYEQLGREIAGIVHNGAYVDFLHTYERMRPANVLGTREVVRLAATDPVKPLFYTSTIGVFNTADAATVFREDEDASGVERMFKGYARSQWVAENTVAAAARRGLPTTIFRIGLISGDSVKGRGAGKSLVDRIIISCLQMGIVPDVEMTLDMVPVDYVAKAWVHLAANIGACGQTYHLTHPTGIELPRLYEWMRSRGYDVEPVSYLDVWRPAALAVAPDNALYALRAFVEEAIVEPVWGRFDSTHAVRDLAGSGVVCPEIDDDLLELYLRQYEHEWRLPSRETVRG